MVTLYDVVKEYRAALAWMADHEEELSSGEVHPELDAMLDQVEGDLNAKVQNVALVIQDQAADVKKLVDEASRLQDRARSASRRIDHLKEWLAFNLRAAGVTKIEGDLIKVGLRKNSAPSIKPEDPEFIPEEFRKVVVSFDGTAAKKHLKDAGKLPADIGRYEIDGLIVERGQHLRIW
jgi:hypothetical protein